MGGQNGIVWFHDGVSELRRGVNGELEFGLLSVVGGETFKQESTEPGTGSTSEGVEDKETLETRAVVGKAPDPIHSSVDLFSADGVVTTGVYRKKKIRVEVPMSKTR